MINTLSIIVTAAFFICYFVFFHLSVRKCFYKGNRSRVSLFFAILFSNPFVSYLLVVFSMFMLSYISSADFFIRISDTKNPNPLFNVLFFSVTALVYLALLFLSSLKIGKWLGVKNRMLVTFLYLMYGVILFLTMEDSPEKAFPDNPTAAAVLDLVVYTLLLIATILLYFLVIKMLAKLVDRNYDLNWKVFIIPPAVFIFIYETLAMGFLNTEILSGKYLLAVIVTYLFIWAFYIILKNINATAEAIEAKDHVKALSVEVMEALAHTIDAKDEYTKGHSIRVAKYSRMLAEKLGLSAEQCENIYYMALLHDIGKIGVPNEIINSTSKLTDEEYAIIKKHPALGADILSEIKSNPDLVTGARWHHERYDGKGYPDGRQGEDIPFLARIIGVADSYDAMTSNRSYRRFLPQEVVRSEIEKNSGTQFDPAVAACMLEIIDADTDYVLHE